MLEASHRGLWAVSLDMDPVLVLACLHEIVGGLASQPELGIRPACLLQPERHLRRDCRAAVENPGQGVPGNAQHPRRFGHTQTERFQAVLADAASGMRSPAGTGSSIRSSDPVQGPG